MKPARIFAADLLGVRGREPDALTAEQRAELEACSRSFLQFLKHWRFINRESGEVAAFDSLWPGQRRLADLMGREPWIFALKAGKLGFTELACAFDGWVARFGQPNARVHVFSRNADAAEELLRYIRFGLTHLPE